MTCHNGRKKLNKHHCQLRRLSSSPALIHPEIHLKAENLSLILKLWVLYRLSAFTMICHLSTELMQRCIFSAKRERKIERRRSWWRETDTDRGTIWSFIVLYFLSQMFFLNWLMLFLLLLTVVNSWCVGWIVWISVCSGLACVCLYICGHGHCAWAFHTCACVNVCVSQIWMHSVTLFTGCAAWEVCVRANAIHSAAMSNWNRLEPWRQSNSGCVCRPAVIFVLHHALSGFFLLLFIHNEIDCFVGSCRK